MDTRCIGYSEYCVDNAAVWALNTSQYSLKQHILPDGGEVSSSLPPPPTRSVFSGGGNVVAETWDKHTLGRRKRGHNITAREPPSHQAGVRRGRTAAKQQQGTRSYFGGEKQKWQQMTEMWEKCWLIRRYTRLPCLCRKLSPRKLLAVSRRPFVGMFVSINHDPMLGWC